MNATEDTVEEVVRELVLDAGLRRDIGRAQPRVRAEVALRCRPARGASTTCTAACWTASRSRTPRSSRRASEFSIVIRPTPDVLTGTRISLGPVAEEDLPRLHGWVNDRELVLLGSPYRPVHSATTGVVGERVRATRRSSCSRSGCWTTTGWSEPASCSGSTRATARRAPDPDRRSRGSRPGARHGGGQAPLAARFRRPRSRTGLLARLSTNARAIAAYEKSGFIREGVLRRAATSTDDRGRRRHGGPARRVGAAA